MKDMTPDQIKELYPNEISEESLHFLDDIETINIDEDFEALEDLEEDDIVIVHVDDPNHGYEPETVVDN